MITGIDHIVIMVSDLEQAAQAWGAAGFNVMPGGKHPRGTHNALITFQDGAYLELIAFWEPDYDAHRWHRFQNSGIGLIDHALGSSDLAAEVNDVTVRGVSYRGPVPGARSRPDGVELAWRTAHADGRDDHALPFLIDDISDRALRVPAGDQAVHSNGVKGVDTLELLVADLDTPTTEYARVVNTDATLPFAVGPHTVTLTRPEDGSAAAKRLEQHGAGPYSVRFHGSSAFEIDPATLDGARLSCVVR